MSSLIFSTEPEKALVVTDTLAVDETYRPAFFVTKAHYLPHLRFIIAGTGLGNFADKWFIRANWGLFGGIEHIANFAPRVMRELWDECEAHGMPTGLTTTIYHIGFSERTNQIIAYAFRSTSDFEPDVLSGYGLYVKPEWNEDWSQEFVDGSLQDKIRAIMDSQRSIQAELPAENRVYIGGMAMAMELTREGCSHYPVFEFPDHQEQLRSALKNFRR